MKPATATAPTSEIAVTLTDALWRRLRREAARLGVPLEWLVAGLVCDTLEPPGVPAPSVRRPVLGGARAVFFFFSGMPTASFRS